MTETLLLIDSDLAWGKVLKKVLAKHGFLVELAYDAQTGLKMMYQLHPNLIILDALIAKREAWQLCSRIRELSPAPIIMLSALEKPEYLLRGLECGADDYVTKTVGSKELAARIRALLRRCGSGKTNGNGDKNVIGHSTIFEFEHLVVDFARHRVLVDGKPVHLTPTEFRLLSVLTKYTGRALPHDFLLREVWGRECQDSSIHVRLYIRYLRRKLEKDPTSPQLITSEWGIGYRFG